MGGIGLQPCLIPVANQRPKGFIPPTYTATFLTLFLNHCHGYTVPLASVIAVMKVMSIVGSVSFVVNYFNSHCPWLCTLC